MNLLIVSTSSVYGEPYLSYLKEECADFFANAPKILFIPFARPGGMTHEAYTAKAKEVFAQWGFEMRGAHEFADADEGCRWADGFFTGGGNTFVLAKTLHESGYFKGNRLSSSRREAVYGNVGRLQHDGPKYLYNQRYAYCVSANFRRMGMGSLQH